MALQTTHTDSNTITTRPLWAPPARLTKEQEGGQGVSKLDSLSDLFGEPLSVYTRLQAIFDGVLVDVSEMASEAGFRVPVAVTAGVWEDCCEWYDEDSQRQTIQTCDGRLWDLCWMAALAARRGGQVVNFQLYRIPRGGKGTRPRLVSLKAVCGPDDDGNPCVTIMGIDED